MNYRWGKTGKYSFSLIIGQKTYAEVVEMYVPPGYWKAILYLVYGVYDDCGNYSSLYKAQEFCISELKKRSQELMRSQENLENASVFRIQKSDYHNLAMGLSVNGVETIRKDYHNAAVCLSPNRINHEGER